MKNSVDKTLFKPPSSDLSDPSDSTKDSDSDSLELILEKDVTEAAEGNTISSSSWTPIATGSTGRSKAKQKVKELSATSKFLFTLNHSVTHLPRL